MAGRAVSPQEVPPVPENMTGWRRSTRRGSIYHLHLMGEAACGRLHLDRHRSESTSRLGDMQYWGVCSRCLRIATREAA